MARIISLILILTLQGCVITNLGFKRKQNPVAAQKTEETRDMGMFSKAGPTTRSQTAWLDTFIETEKSLRSVSKNLYLHDTPENRDSMSQETNQLFEETYFATDDFNTLKTVTNEEIRSRIIKSLMLAVQIGIDINPVSKEMRDENNKNIGERLALLEKIAKGRDDIQLSDIDLDCSGTTKCIDYFNIKYNELR